MRRVVVGVLVVGVLLVGWSLVEPKLVRESHHEVVLPGLPEAWEGAEVAVISDLQIGMWWSNEGTVEQVVDRIVDDGPATALLAGDFLYSTEPDPATQIDRVVALVRPLVDADIPTYAVLGNHDVKIGAGDALTEAFEQAGIEVLDNAAVALPGPGGDGDGPPLHLVGIAPRFNGLADPEGAVADVPDDAARLVFMHNPVSFLGLPPDTAPLAVAGHTHCGQLRLPFAPDWSYLNLLADERIAVDGWIDNYGEPGNQLYVTCGIGMSRLPIRFNARPELTVFELVSD